jgi:hypothetical protein
MGNKNRCKEEKEFLEQTTDIEVIRERLSTGVYKKYEKVFSNGSEVTEDCMFSDDVVAFLSEKHDMEPMLALVLSAALSDYTLRNREDNDVLMEVIGNGVKSGYEATLILVEKMVNTFK